MQTVVIDCRTIKDWESFHDTFEQAFGFPAWYGRNLDAWVDLMTNLDEKGYSDFSVLRGETVMLWLENAGKLKQVVPDILGEILELAAICNYRRTKAGQTPILLVSCCM